MKTVRTDRSRVETAQRCLRQRFLEYHQDGTGIVSARKPLPLAVGGSVHEGLAVLLVGAQQVWPDFQVGGAIEELAVRTALEDFARHRGTLALDTTEVAGQQAGPPVADDVMRQQLADSLGLSVEDAGLAQLQQQAGQGAAQFDAYLWQEQSALVEGLVRAYARRRLRPLLEQYEVLEVEREGEWLLSEWQTGEWVHVDCLKCGWYGVFDNQHHWPQQCPNGCGNVHIKVDDVATQLKFMSRPDALLRDRTDNSLYILSFKTAASWDVRKARDAQHDMQGLSEGVEVERRLGEWWDAIQTARTSDAIHEVCDKLNIPHTYPNQGMMNYLSDLPAPPRILGIRYEYMLKSYRGKDKDLSSRVGFEAWTQRSHLIRQYVAHSVPKSKGESAYHHGDVCWSWEWLKPDGTESKLAWQNWSSRPVWDQPGGVKGWIDALDASAMQMSQYDSTVGMEPREMGWAGPGQALGTTKDHPLDSVFISPIIVYRNEDDLRDMVEQIEAQETRIAEAVAQVESASDDGERRHLLNVFFPQTRHACEYPACQFVKICYGGEDVRRDPIASGNYRARTFNHPQERGDMEASSGLPQLPSK